MRFPKYKTLLHLFLTLLASATTVSISYYVLARSQVSALGLFYPVTFLVAWYFGFKLAILSTLICAFSANYFYYEPRFSFMTHSLENLIRLAIFIFASIFVAWTVNRGKKSDDKFKESQKTLAASENRYRLASRATRDAIWDWDLITDEVSWNEAVTLEYGYPSSFQKGSMAWKKNSIHPEDRDRIISDITAAIQHGKENWTAEYRFLKNNGTYAYVLDRGFIVKDNQNKPIRMIGAMQETTEFIRSLQEFTNLRERFRRVSKATNLGIWYCDLPFNELVWNAEAKTHYFLPEDAQINVDVFYKHVHPQDRERVKQAIEHSIRYHSTYDIEYRTFDPETPGREKWIRSIGWTDCDLTGKPIHFDGITFDISALKKIEQERKEFLIREQIAHEQTREALRTRDEFMSVASHELKTPLTSLHLQLQLLSKSIRKAIENPNDKYAKLLAPEKLSSTLSSCEKQSARLSDLLSELLDLTRVRLGRLHLAKEQTDLSILTQEVLDRFREEIGQKGSHLIYHFSSTPLGNWDRSRIEQVVTNLISNAIKYGEQQPIEITVEPNQDRTSAILKVKDFGMGISAEMQGKIFERFERAVSSQKISGLGLGLYISRQIVEAHGGRIHVRSQLQQGSEFIVELPTWHEGNSVVLAGNSPWQNLGETVLDPAQVRFYQ